MDITWDPAKARSNIKKHGVAFSDAEPVLYDPYGITAEDDSSDTELRFVTIGLDALGRILVVVYTYRVKAYASFRLAQLLETRAKRL